MPSFRLVLILIAAALLFCAAGTITTTSSAMPVLIQGMEDLQAGQHQLLKDPATAEHSFQKANTELTQAAGILQAAPWYSKLLTPIPPFRWQVQLTKAAVALAAAGTTVGSMSTNAPALPHATDPNLFLSGASNQLIPWFETQSTNLDFLQSQLSEANTELSALPSWLLFTHRAQFVSLRDDVHQSTTVLPQLRQTFDELERQFGRDDANPHTFMVLFENDGELRPSGGFGGSYALVTASGGRIRGFTFGTDIYKFDRAFERTNTLLPSEPLQTVTAWLGFRDASVSTGFRDDYSPRFASFYEQATGVHIDGIVYVTSSVLEDLLRVTGPIPLPGQNTTASADTISSQLTQAIDADYYKDPANQAIREPKTIINELIPILLDKLLTLKGGASSLISTIATAGAHKNIQLWSADTALNRTLTALGPTDQPGENNWFKYVDTNIGGMKSSHSVQTQIAVSQSSSLFHSKITQTIDVTRTHTGSTTWPDGRNRAYIEIYLPSEAADVQIPAAGQGGEYLLDDGALAEHRLKRTTQAPVLEKGQDANGQWQKVGLWASIDPGQADHFQVSYSLPATSTYTEHLQVINQAGARNEMLSIWGRQIPLTQNLSLNH